MSALLALVLASAPLTVSIDSPQKQLYVGEPWKVVVTCTAGKAPVDVLMETDRFQEGTLQFRVDDGHGERFHREPNQAPTVERISVSTPIRAREKVMNNYTLQGGLFSRPGRYTVRVEQRAWSLGRRPGPPVTSKKITVEVVDPPEEERVVASWLARSARNAWVAVMGYGDPEVAELDRLLADYPRSRFLLAPRLRRLEVLTGRSPSEVLGQDRLLALRGSDQEEYRRVIREHYAGQLRLVTTFEGWGVYEEDALALALDLAGKARDEAEQARIRAELRDRFPRSATMNRMEHRRLAGY